MAFQNIAISGRIGVGTTTLAHTLANRLGWSLRDGSQIFRDVSMQAGFDLETTPQRYESAVDKLVDRETRQSLLKKSRIVVTAKLAGYLSRDIDHTLRVLVRCPLEERIARYAASRGYTQPQSKELIALREQEDQRKWERLYGPHDFFDPSLFSVIIDSLLLSLEQEVSSILARLDHKFRTC